LASMAVLDTAAKYREEIQYARYQAGRDTIEKFKKDPPYAYVIPREQHDLPTAATLVEKLIIDGIEVTQASDNFKANGTTYKAGSWVVLMDQPFSTLVKELFEVQKYPELQAQAPAAPASGGGRGGGGRGATGAVPAQAPATISQLPYDVTGWTLPMQMGVEVAAVREPVSDDGRRTLRKIETVEVAGKVDGNGPVFAFSHNANASLRAVNEILDAGGTVSFGKTDGTIYATGRAGPILQKNGVDAKSLSEAPPSFPVKKPPIGIYEPWARNMD